METWKPVVGFEGFYAVSSKGRVKRLAGSPTCKVDRLLKPMEHHTGARYVSLRRDNCPTGVFVHLLMLEAFVGPCPDGHIANHRDDNLSHNVLSNLRYVTYSWTLRRAIARGRWVCRDMSGEKNTRASLTIPLVQEIRRRLKDGESPTTMAKDLGVNRMAIYDIRYDRAWSHVP